MSFGALTDAANNFSRDYGSRPDMATVVKALQGALNAIVDATLSPGMREAKNAQFREVTFNHAGQEPRGPSEPPAEVQTGTQRHSQPSSARGSETDRQGRNRYSGQFMSTAHRRSS